MIFQKIWNTFSSKEVVTVHVMLHRYCIFYHIFLPSYYISTTILKTKSFFKWKKKSNSSSFALQLLLLTCEICHWNQTTHCIEKSIYNNSNFYTIDYVGTSWKSYVIKFFDSIVRNQIVLCSSRSILTWQANNFFESQFKDVNKYMS